MKGRRRRIAVYLLTLAIVPRSLDAQPDGGPEGERPIVRLIATGGTIANREGGRLTAAELLALVPDLDTYVEPEAEQFSNVSSGALTLTDYLGLSRRITKRFADEHDLQGIVVTAGTDTLEELAYFLHLTVRSDHPVVVVGSMRRPGAPGYDGDANLLAAFRVAGDPASRGRGTVVVLGDEIYSARDVTKTDARRPDAFESPVGHLGVVDRDRVVYLRRDEKRHSTSSEFDVEDIDALPRVDVLLAYQDAPGDLVTAAVDRGARGLILGGIGAGSASGSQSDALADAVERGTVVVSTTRTGSGRVTSRARGRLAGEDLTPIKARVLLMLALTLTDDPDRIQRMFREY